jgi:hypothetical protein
MQYYFKLSKCSCCVPNNFAPRLLWCSKINCPCLGGYPSSVLYNEGILSDRSDPWPNDGIIITIVFGFSCIYFPESDRGNEYWVFVVSFQDSTLRDAWQEKKVWLYPWRNQSERKVYRFLPWDCIPHVSNTEDCHDRKRRRQTRKGLMIL